MKTAIKEPKIGFVYQNEHKREYKYYILKLYSLISKQVNFQIL